MNINDLNSSDEFYSAPVPDTGQTTCYDDKVTIDCPIGGRFFGQDANYNFNPMSFTKYDIEGNEVPYSDTNGVMVRDNVTGLIWELKTDDGSVHDKDNKYDWYDSNPATNGGDPGSVNNNINTEEFIKTLNSDAFGGYSDWRMPAIHELISIVNYNSYNPAIVDYYFPNINPKPYFSSTTNIRDQNNANKAWGVNFDNGRIYSYYKNTAYYVRAVRSEQSRLLDKYVINNDKTVTDISTGLMWERFELKTKKNWESAISYCENLILSNYDDWRLPDQKELLSKYSIYDPSISNKYFPNRLSDYYWSSTTYANSISMAWGVNLGDETDYFDPKTYMNYAHAVRSGQSRSPGNLIILSPRQASKWFLDDPLQIKWDRGDIDENEKVEISISYEGGKQGSFETVTDQTENDEFFEWDPLKYASVNCVIKITPIYSPDRASSEGLFRIVDKNKPYITPIDDQSIDVDQQSISISFSVSDTDNGPLNVWAESSNQDLVPDANIDLGGDSPVFYTVTTAEGGLKEILMTIIFIKNKFGKTTITLTVNDAGYLTNVTSFDLYAPPTEYDDNQTMMTPVPGSGQVTCYDNDEITDCPDKGENFYGQDANYNINPMSFTKLDSNGNKLDYKANNWDMVRDNVTGLIWEVKTDDDSVHDKDNQYDWYDSNPETNGGDPGSKNNNINTEEFIKSLNSDEFGGYSDWRMPTINELVSIVNYNSYNPAIIDSYFPNIMSNPYFSSTPYSKNLSWGVNFEAGDVSKYYKSIAYYVRAVRSVKSQLLGKYIINNNNTVTDITTGLMWERFEKTTGENWQTAISYCENLTLSNYNDWRLPDQKELLSIVNYSMVDPSISKYYFPNIKSDHYWSSTTYENKIDNAWIVNFEYGHGSYLTKNKHLWYYARAVRSGQSRSYGNVTIISPRQASKWLIGHDLQVIWECADTVESVTISIFNDGGKQVIFKTVTENDGDYKWPITKPASVNCMIKITPINSPDKGSSEGLFRIVDDDPPFISKIDDKSIDADQMSIPLSFSISDTDNGPLNVWATSSNQDLVPDENIDLGGDLPVFYTVTSAEGGPKEISMNITLYKNKFGSTTITLTVNDAGYLTNSSSFDLYVQPPEYDHSQTVFAPVPGTGQAICYDNYKRIDFPGKGEDFYGQDANYNINPMSHTKLDIEGNELSNSANNWAMVKDNVTGLIWEVKTDDNEIHDKDNKYDWYDSNPATNGGNAGDTNNNINTEDFIKSLNSDEFGGYSDWRLPTINELISIVNYNSYNPAIINTYFPNTISDFYWSSTTKFSSNTYAWGVNFNQGKIEYKYKPGSYYIRAVRSEQLQLFDNLIINNDKTVTDIRTGLMWERFEIDTRRRWDDAILYCENLTLSNYNDWRLPNLKELLSIVNYSMDNPSISYKFFPNITYSSWDYHCWSSTTFSHNNNNAWRVYFENVDNDDCSKSYGLEVRAVRSGQSRSYGNLIILSPRQASKWIIGQTMTVRWDNADINENVQIGISYDGGKQGSFNTISENTENDGFFEWPIPEKSASVNCMIAITPVNSPEKGTSEGLFCIVDETPPFITKLENQSVNLGQQSISLKFSISDTDDGPLNVWAKSSNQVLVPDETIDLGGDLPVFYTVTTAKGGPKAITMTIPIANQIGEATITLTVNDAGYLTDVTSFILSVSPQEYTYDSSQIVFAPVPGSGQATCYDNDKKIDCPEKDENFYGQDANYNINPMSFTKLDSQGKELSHSATTWDMVKDNVTGLVWEVKTDDESVHDKDNEYQWYDSNPGTNGGDAGYTESYYDNTEKFIQTLNSNEYGGYSDWRLPTINELISIVNYNSYDPAIVESYFPNIISWYYWTSTTYANDSQYAWGINFDHGGDFIRTKSYQYKVRAVRSGKASLCSKQLINNDRSVTDITTGLMWERFESKEVKAWETSISYCEHLTLSNFHDWRLPSQKELKSIVNYSMINPSISNYFFPNIKLDFYWSSTTNANNTDHAWGVKFENGYDGSGKKSHSYYARAVRSGQSRSSGKLFIRSPRQASKWFIGDTLTVRWNTAGIDENVQIGISYEGGKQGTFQTIIQNTVNDGLYEWDIPISTPASVNCMIAITPVNRIDKVSEGLFCIVDKEAPSIKIIDKVSDLSQNSTSIKFSISDTDDGPLNVWAKSSNQVLVPDTIIDLGGDLPVCYTVTTAKGGAKEISTSITPMANQVGVATITLTVYDAGYLTDSVSFDIYVLPPEYNNSQIIYSPVPDTGQEICYDINKRIDCPVEGENFSGQDANYNINPMSYIKLGNNGVELPYTATSWLMVKDKITGLIWEVKTDDDSVHDKDNKYEWYDSNPDTNGGYSGYTRNYDNTEEFIKTLNSNEYGGYSDWRMPTMTELTSIVNYNTYYPAIVDSFFPNISSDFYWSSTTDANDPQNAWGIYFNNGSDNYISKPSFYSVRAVRSQKKRRLDRLIINHDKTITDISTGLMWERSEQKDRKNWETAISYCENLTLSNYGDWRLPSQKELKSIVNYSMHKPSISNNYFPYIKSSYYGYYWSSTTCANNISDVWGVHFDNGSDSYLTKLLNYYTRAVRSGQSRSYGNLIILSPRQASKWIIGDKLKIIWDTADIDENVQIDILYEGGKPGTFTKILEHAENRGFYDWPIPKPASVNCVIKITPINSSDKGTSEGLFSIVDEKKPTITQIDDQFLALNQKSISIPLTFSISDTDDGPLNVWAKSSNQILVPDENIDLGGDLPVFYTVTTAKDGAKNISMMITPHTNNVGESTITLIVNDAGYLTDFTSFIVTVSPQKYNLSQTVLSPVPGTGQTACYDNDKEIDCPGKGENFYGQDANYNINPMSFTKLNSKGNELSYSATTWDMVRDNVTGLIWEVKTDDGYLHGKENKYAWYDNNPDTNGGDAGYTGINIENTEKFIKELNTNEFGGYTDWRMPSIDELMSIVNYDSFNAAIVDSYFPNIISDSYWSSTTHADDPDKAWGVNFQYGQDSYDSKNHTYYVRAVRSENPLKFDNLIINNNETVTDITTGLMWERFEPVESNKWETAIAYCENLMLSNYKDWRLPGLKELKSIVNYSMYNPSISNNFFPNIRTSFYWSSTTRVNNSSSAWGVSFQSGYNNYFLNKSSNYLVRAVRSGQSRSYDNLIILSPRQASKWNIGETLTVLWDSFAVDKNERVIISISYEGGEQGTFKKLTSEPVENNGHYKWEQPIPKPASVNCMIKITPINRPEKETSEGLFCIVDKNEPSISQINKQIMHMRQKSNLIKFTISDTDDGPLNIWAKSANQNLVPDKNIDLGGDLPVFYTVTTAAGGPKEISMSITPVSDQSGEAKITLTVIDAGYLKKSESFDFVVLADNQTYYTIVATSGTGGQISPTGIFNAEKNESITFTVLPETGYELDQFLLNSETQTLSNDQYLLPNINSDHTIFVSYKRNQYAINASAINGSIKPEGLTYVNSGENILFSFTPDNGYKFDYLNLDGNIIQTSNNQYPLNNITRNHDISVYFKAQKENSFPDIPEQIFPSDDELIFENEVTLKAGTYHDPDNDPHTCTYWMIRTLHKPYQCSEFNVPFCHKSLGQDLESYKISGLVTGMKYAWTVAYYDFCDDDPVFKNESTFTIGISELDEKVNIGQSAEVKNFRMVSFVQWPDNPSSMAVLGNEMNHHYDTDNYRIGTYDPTLNDGRYIECNQNFNIEPGKSFWILAKNGMACKVNGVFVSLSESIDVQLRYNQDSFNGWNMIACPNARNYSWNKIQVLIYDSSGNIVDEYGTIIGNDQIKTIAQLDEDNPIINKKLWSWKTGNYDYETSGAILYKYEGYWVKVRQNNVYLRFHPGAAASSKKRIRKTRISSETNYQAYELPPAPMAGFNENATSVSNCFISNIAYGVIQSIINYHIYYSIIIVFILILFIKKRRFYQYLYFKR